MDSFILVIKEYFCSYQGQNMFQLTFFSGQIDMYFLTFVNITSNLFLPLLYTINIAYYGIIIKFWVRDFWILFVCV